MSLIARSTGAKDFQKVSQGNHIARCVRVVDFGTQVYTYNNETKSALKVQISFEIPGERIEINGEDLPSMLSYEATNSLHENSNLRPMLESWRGRNFTTEELEGFELKKLLGVSAMITVMHVENKKGKVFAKIVAIADAKIGGKKVDCPPQESPFIFYEIEQGIHGAAYEGLPKWIQDKICKAKELNGHDDAPVATDEVASEAKDGSDLPF